MAGIESIGGMNGLQAMLNAQYANSRGSLQMAQAASSLGNVSATTSIFDLKQAQKSTQAMLDTFRANNERVGALKEESADFLKQYTGRMNEMNSTAGKLANGGLSNLMQNAADNGQTTEAAAQAATSAVRNMVDSYNSTRQMLADNADRSPGVEQRLADMGDWMTSDEQMKAAGITMNEDGSLALDEERLTAALRAEDSEARQMALDAIEGKAGMAQAVQANAKEGLSTSAGKLVANDMMEAQRIQDADPIRSFAQSLRGGSAYALNNTAAMGILMNMAV